jgi:hypothetical protein
VHGSGRGLALSCCSEICLEGLRNTTEASMRVFSVPAEYRTGITYIGGGGEHSVAQFIEALCYNPEGLGFFT